MKNLTLNQVRFTDSRFAGLIFADCSRFAFSPGFHNCLIDNVVFSANDLKKASFPGCIIRNTDFMGCDLREADFSECRFENSSFRDCRLEEADFRRARDYHIDPFTNRLKGARFNLSEAVSFLSFLGIDVE